MESEHIEKEFINPRHAKRIYTAKWVIEIPANEPYVIVRPRQKERLTPHDLLLYHTIEALKGQIDGYKADKVHYPGIPKLNTSLIVGKARVDLITSQNGTYEYWEIKTPRELGEDRTRKQLFEYLNHINSINLVTSPDGEATAKQIIEVLNLKDRVKLYIVEPPKDNMKERAKIKMVRW